MPKRASAPTYLGRPLGSDHPGRTESPASYLARRNAAIASLGPHGTRHVGTPYTKLHDAIASSPYDNTALDMENLRRAAEAGQKHLNREDKLNHTEHTGGHIEYHDKRGRFTSKANAVKIT